MSYRIDPAPLFALAAGKLGINLESNSCTFPGWAEGERLSYRDFPFSFSFSLTLGFYPISSMF